MSHKKYINAQFQQMVDKSVKISFLILSFPNGLYTTMGSSHSDIIMVTWSVESLVSD